MANTVNGILISQQDHDRLSEMLRLGSFKSVALLAVKLSNAKIVLQTQIPSDVVTMNSVLQLTNTVSGKIMRVGLVYPLRADGYDDRVSILTSVGVELLGSRVGDIIQWPLSDGQLHPMKITALLFQPESYGAWNL